MLTARFVRAGTYYALLFAAVFGMLFVLAACDATGGVGEQQVTPGRPTSTVQAVNTRPRATATLEEFFPVDPTEEVEATNTPRVRATATREPEPTEEPTEEPTATTEVEEPTPVIVGDYTLYNASEGGWSLEYPADWDLNEDPPNTQFLEPTTGEAFIQVTFSEDAGDLSHEELANLASDQFAISFEDYVESGKTEQSDGSYRIDFKFSAGGIDWDAQAFVEGRQGNLYMLMLATTEDAYQLSTYEDIISHVISSYSVPK